MPTSLGGTFLYSDLAHSGASVYPSLLCDYGHLEALYGSQAIASASSPQMWFPRMP